jgi:hypothetical protein
VIGTIATPWAQPAVLDLGAMHADHRGDGDAQQATESLGLPTDAGQGAVEAVLVVPHELVAALVDLSGPLLGVDDEHPTGADDEVDAPCL